MSFNGYRTYETWAFMLYFEDYIYETLKEQKEYENQEIDYETVYNMVESILDETRDSVDNVEGNPFLSDLINAAFSEIDKHEITETILEQLKEETSNS